MFYYTNYSFKVDYIVGYTGETTEKHLLKCDCIFNVYCVDVQRPYKYIYYNFSITLVMVGHKRMFFIGFQIEIVNKYKQSYSGSKW